MQLLKEIPKNLSLEVITGALIEQELLWLNNETVVYLCSVDKKTLKTYLLEPSLYHEELKKIYVRLFVEPNDYQIKSFKLPKVYRDETCSKCGKNFRTYNKVTCPSCHSKYENCKA